MTAATTSATTTRAKTPDYDDIIRVVQRYLDGFRGDVNKLNEKVGERGASQAAELRFEIDADVKRVGDELLTPRA
jgi:hypothetical protein